MYVEVKFGLNLIIRVYILSLNYIVCSYFWIILVLINIIFIKKKCIKSDFNIHFIIEEVNLMISDKSY